MAYLYCSKCGIELPDPRQMEDVREIREIIKKGFICSECGQEDHDHYDGLFEELFNRLDNNEEDFIQELGWLFQEMRS